MKIKITKARTLGFIITCIVTSFTFKYQHHHISDMVTSTFQDSIWVDVGIKDSNLLFFSIQNQSQVNNLMIDTTSLSGSFAVTRNNIFITNEFVGSYHSRVTPPVLINRDSTFYYEKRIDQPIDKLSLRLNIFILDGIHLLKYDNVLQAKVLNYKKLTQVRLDVESHR